MSSQQRKSVLLHQSKRIEKPHKTTETSSEKEQQDPNAVLFGQSEVECISPQAGEVVLPFALVFLEPFWCAQSWYRLQHEVRDGLAVERELLESNQGIRNTSVWIVGSSEGNFGSMSHPLAA